MTQLKPWIQQCLLGPDPVERTVVILTSKVAQKSYGTEKRFLCPPPTAILVGTTWWTLKSDATLAPPALTVCISGENTSQTGYIEWYTVSGVTVGQTGIDWYHNHQQEPLAAGKSVSKHLFINDADEKRKRVECLVKVQLANGLHLGTFASKGIKVISKPSKKRQSVKNMELCIHHGTTVSLFNRIRSQTVSTKYLGVSSSRSSPFAFPGHRQKTHTTDVSDGTCFVARTASWDPFIVWVVDTTRSPGDGREIDTPEDYIGRNAYTPSVAYPPPPAIALKNKTGQLVPVLYNQHIVLQCLTTGLVSPVMIIRKVDKASTVVGGALQTDSLCVVGGDYGEEALGDPVSQLHKIALQIVQDPSSTPSHLSSHSPSHTQESKMPNTHSPVSYLACLNDMVGMHKTIEPRKPLHSLLNRGRSGSTHSLEGKRKPSMSASSSSSSTSTHGRRMSAASINTTHQLGSYWCEDVSDAAVWTIVGTDCAVYSFWSLPDDMSPQNSLPMLVPSLTYYTKESPLLSYTDASDQHSIDYTDTNEHCMALHGEGFSRDLQVWFGDTKAFPTDYRSRELLMCRVPPRTALMESAGLESNVNTTTGKTMYSVPLLLVRSNGTVYKTNKTYSFA
ncbi:beta-trefoil DNA-binding domain-containing protein [Spinellus fusiger]|nr:beta-trefoil DNA-binding domain-containing protein [Spinellus fusiger]